MTGPLNIVREFPRLIKHDLFINTLIVVLETRLLCELLLPLIQLVINRPVFAILSFGERLHGCLWDL